MPQSCSVIYHTWSLILAFFQPLVRFRTCNPHSKRFSFLWHVFGVGVGVGQFRECFQAIWFPIPVEGSGEFMDFSLVATFHESR